LNSNQKTTHGLTTALQLSMLAHGAGSIASPAGRPQALADVPGRGWSAPFRTQRGEPLMPRRAGMTRWYSVPRLVSIGVRVAISTVFGQFADRRDSLAAERPLDPAAIDPAFSYTADADQDFWIDYVADNGDGWDSTYAIARLLAAAQITPQGANGAALPRGRVLVMGGDQVYPTPSRDDYYEKLVAPYREASRNWPEGTAADLYAVPGNHDWYDGLSAFLNLFCWRQLAGVWSEAHRGRPIGGWRTQQTRSYFVLQLPHGWWLWGTDIQLTNYIDQQQMNYFEHAARHWMPADACDLVPPPR